MPTTALLSEDEYLRTSFPDVDRDLHDGEVRERSMPNLNHSRAVVELIGWFRSRRDHHHLFVETELRLRLGPSQYRVADVSVFWPVAPASQVPEFPPLIAIEVLSPDDRFSDVRRKLAEYRDYGVKHAWLVDPETRTFSVFDGTLHEVDSFRIPEVGLSITRADLFA